MPIQATCPQCDASYNLADDQDGKKVRCKKCQTVFSVGGAKPRRAERATAPAAERPSRAAAAKTIPAARRRRDPDEDEDDYEEEERRPRRRGKEPVKSGPPMALILGGSAAAAVLLVGGVIGLIVWTKSGKDDDKRASTSQEVNNGPTNPQNQPGVTPTVTSTNSNTAAGSPINPSPPVTGTPNSPSQPDATTFAPPVVENPKDTELVGENTPPAANGDLNAEMLKRVKKSTVMIRVEMPDGGKASGSGFFAVEDGLVMTNAHVLDMLSPESRPPKKIEVVLNSGEAGELILGGQILGLDRGSDLAVLKAFSTKAGKVVIPPPLPIKSAKNLGELQKLFVCGFPLGDQLGKEISIRPTTVTSLRKKNGALEKVQVEGGMTPGNSGGPVVDSRGDVVGVAVSIILGTQLSFAIPGDQVQSFVTGRFAEINMGQGYFQSKDVMMPVTITMLDPLNRVKDLGLEVWIGDSAGPRPATVGNAPAPSPGDSAHVKTNLDYQKNEGKGEVKFPSPQAGKEYWIQPSWTNGAGKKVWASASVYKPPSPPVERKPANLVFRPKRGNRRLELKTKTTLAFKVNKKEEHAIQLITEANLQEAVLPDTRGTAIRLSYDKFTLGMTVDDQPPPNNSPFKSMFDTVNQYMKQVSSNVFQDVRGNIRVDEALTMPSSLPPELQKELSDAHQEVLHTIQSLTIPLPNEKMAEGKSWTEWRILQVDAGRFSESARVHMLYTYLGTCRRGGREEAVVSLKGEVRGKEGAEDKSGGVWDGTVNVDLVTGQVVLAKGKVTFDVLGFSRSGEPLKLAGRIDMELKRSTP